MDDFLADDRKRIFNQTRGLWEDLRGARIFMTGGTGFIGRWLLESFIEANRNLKLKARALVLTRDESVFRQRCPRLAGDGAVTFHRGDVRGFDFPAGHFSHVVHGAAPVISKSDANNPQLIADTIIDGTRHVLEFAGARGAGRFLFISSGAVYGKQPEEMTHIPEDYPGAPDPCDPLSAYGEAKRTAELLCALYAKRLGISCLIARGFTFCGPYLPLDRHFAIGNFIRDALSGGPIRVLGSGAPIRSYLYSADMAVWLWTILLRGATCHPYNVGSEKRITISELARTVAKVLKPGLKVVLAKKPAKEWPREQYVPSVKRARSELGLRETVDLEEAILKAAMAK